MLLRLLLPAALLTLTWGHSGPSRYCRDTQGYFFHCDDTSWGSGSSWRRWYGEGGYSDMSRSLGRGQVTFAPSGGVQLTCDFSQNSWLGSGRRVTDIVWRKVDRGSAGTVGSGSFYTDGRYGSDGFSSRASYVNIGSVEAGFRGSHDSRYNGYNGGNYVGGSYGGGNYGGGNYDGGNYGGGNYGGGNYNGGGYNSFGSGYFGNSGSGYYGGYDSNSMGSFSGGYVRDDYISPSTNSGPSGSGFSSGSGYSSGFYGSGFGSGFGFSSGCGGGRPGCGGGGGGGGCGGRPRYRCLDSRSRRRRRRHVSGSSGGRPASCRVTQGPSWSTLTLARPGPADEGRYLCVGRTGAGTQTVSMEVELSRYTAGGRYRSALMKTEPDRVVREGGRGDELAAEKDGE